ncbi:MAG: TonB-dependent receptor plug domain-containing protein [Gammaproteobacteria bacterium]
MKVETTEDEGFSTDSTGTATRTDTPLPTFRSTSHGAAATDSLAGRHLSAGCAAQCARHLYAAPEGGTQSNQVFFLRGFPLNQDIFIDGVRDLGEYNRDLFATESVEVLKGSSSLLFGRGSTGGLVNQETKVADRDVHRELALQAGSFDQKRVTADFSTVADNNNSALRVVGLLEDSGSYRYPEPVKKTGLAPSFWTQIGDATSATLSYYYLKEDSVTDYGQPALSSTRARAPSSASATFRPARITALRITISRTTRRASPRSRSIMPSAIR